MKDLATKKREATRKHLAKVKASQLNMSLEQYMQTMGVTLDEYVTDEYHANLRNQKKSTKVVKKLYTTTVANTSSDDEDDDFEAVEVDMNTLEVDEKVLEVFRTNTAYDKIASKSNGVKRATVNIITGESGAGKTTLATNVATLVKKTSIEEAINEALTREKSKGNFNATFDNVIYDNSKVVNAGFVSGEMNRIDWFEECHDNQTLKMLPVLFVQDIEHFEGNKFLKALSKMLSKYEFCVVDSFEVLLDKIKEATGMNGKKAESWLITELARLSEKNYQTFLVLQQYTKDGSYVGSTKLKHNTTSMMYVMIDEDGQRYCTFDKNRRGGHMINKRLYFTKSRETGMLQFNEAEFEMEMKASNMSNESKNTENKNVFTDSRTVEESNTVQLPDETLNALASLLA